MSDLVALYEAGDEDVRMVTAANRVEWERTLELLERWLPPAPARVLDIGGGSGRYAAWLTERGYEVHLLDRVPKHVRQAHARGIEACVGDARALPYADGSADAVLMLGPLYHLPSASDRARALAEAVRCSVPGAVVLAAAMSRWAKPAVKASRGELGDAAVRGYILHVLERGHDVEGDAFDLVSYNHDPEELHGELVAAGLTDVLVLGLEGPLGAEARRDISLAETAVAAARIAEARAPHLSIHMLARAKSGIG
jgi:SAM-dependent methyltransferase